MSKRSTFTLVVCILTGATAASAAETYYSSKEDFLDRSANKFIPVKCHINAMTPLTVCKGGPFLLKDLQGDKHTLDERLAWIDKTRSFSRRWTTMRDLKKLVNQEFYRIGYRIYGAKNLMKYEDRWKACSKFNENSWASVLRACTYKDPGTFDIGKWFKKHQAPLFPKKALTEFYDNVKTHIPAVCRTIDAYWKKGTSFSKLTLVTRAGDASKIAFYTAEHQLWKQRLSEYQNSEKQKAASKALKRLKRKYPKYKMLIGDSFNVMSWTCQQ